MNNKNGVTITNFPRNKKVIKVSIKIIALLNGVFKMELTILNVLNEYLEKNSTPEHPEKTKKNMTHFK